jgi:steroid delta-isomerase-like uncharacterized protein
MSNLDTHRRAADMFNSRDWDGIAADLADNCEFVDHARGVTVKGRQQCLAIEQEWATAFPDARITSPRYVDGGSTTVLTFTGVGRNDGPLGAFPATGNKATTEFCELREYDVDGKVVRSDLYYDQLTLLEQLGHMQVPADF